MADTKKCPYCGEEIKTVAKKCKHCGEWLDQEKPSSPDATMQAKQVKGKSGVIILFAVIFAIIAIGAIIYFSPSKEASNTPTPTDVVSKDSIRLCETIDSLTVELQNIERELEKYKNNHSMEDAANLSLDMFLEEDKLNLRKGDILWKINTAKYVLKKLPDIRQESNIKPNEDANSDKEAIYITLLLKTHEYGQLANYSDRVFISKEGWIELRSGFIEIDNNIEELNVKLLSPEQCKKELIERKKLYLSFLENALKPAATYAVGYYFNDIPEEISKIKQEIREEELNL